jgi:hypothetical protein
MPRADWNVLKKYSLPKPSDGLLAVNDTVHPITAQCLLADISARHSPNEIYGISTRRRMSLSLHLDVEGPDDVAPLLGFLGDEFPERGRCH